MSFNPSYLGDASSTPINNRVIYVLIAEGQIVRAYADYGMAMQDKARIQALKPKVQIADPVSVKFYDDRALGMSIGQRVQWAQ